MACVEPAKSYHALANEIISNAMLFPSHQHPTQRASQVCFRPTLIQNPRTLALAVASLHNDRNNVRQMPGALGSGRPAPQPAPPQRPPKAVLQQLCRTTGVPPPRFNKLPQACRSASSAPAEKLQNPYTTLLRLQDQMPKAVTMHGRCILRCRAEYRAV